jgi:hypothetical protein
VKYIEKRLLFWCDLRALCIDNGWYDLAGNEDYKDLSAKLTDENGAAVEMTTEKLAEIAEDILAHTFNPVLDFEEDATMKIEAIMYQLNLKCVTYFKKI